MERIQGVRLPRTHRPFVAAMKKPVFIAEVKTKSPFGFESEHSCEKLLDIAVQYGDMVAAYIDPQWGGSHFKLQLAANLAHKNGKLCIAKGIHPEDIDILNSLFHGADLVLVVGRIPPPELAPVCIWEPSCQNDISYASDHTQKIMWNARNLETGKSKEESTVYPEKFDTARWLHKGWMAQAGFISKPDDVHPKADAFIVGEHLPTFVKAL